MNNTNPKRINDFPGIDQKHSFKMFDGDKGISYNYEYFTDYPTEDELDLIRWFSEGGK